MNTQNPSYPLPVTARYLPAEKRRFGPAIAAAAIIHALLLFAVPEASRPEWASVPIREKAPEPQAVSVPPDPIIVESPTNDDHTDQSKLANKGNPSEVYDPGVGEGTKHSVEITVPIEALKPGISLPGIREIGVIDGIPGGGPHGIGPIDARMLDRQPEAVSQIPPRFPDVLKREVSEGKVRAQYIVEKDGRVSHVRILSSTHPEFAAAVERALLRWRFKAGWKNNRPVASRVEQVFDFNLN